MKQDVKKLSEASGGIVMKKSVLMVAGSCLLAGMVMAAGPVTSVNAVGYVKMNTVANKWSLMGAPFSKIGGGTGPLTISDVFGTNGIPDSTIVLFWNGHGYVGEGFIDGYGWDPGTNDVSRSDGFWFTAPVSSPIVLSGEVPAASYASNTVTALTHGYQMISYPYPVSIAITNTALATSASDSDILLQWTGSNYVGEGFIEGYGWDPGTMVLQPGAGYWYFRNGAGSAVWTEPKPYNWP